MLPDGDTNQYSSNMKWIFLYDDFGFYRCQLTGLDCKTEDGVNCSDIDCRRCVIPAIYPDEARKVIDATIEEIEKDALSKH